MSFRRRSPPSLDLLSLLPTLYPPSPPPLSPPSPPFQLETKQNKGPEAAQCVALIEAHKVCLRAEGFQIE